MSIERLTIQVQELDDKLDRLTIQVAKHNDFSRRVAELEVKMDEHLLQEAGLHKELITAVATVSTRVAMLMWMLGGALALISTAAAVITLIVS